LSGRFISLLAAASSMITVVTLFSSQNLGLLERLPVSPGSFPAWTPAAFIRPLIPEAIALALLAILIPAS